MKEETNKALSDLGIIAEADVPEDADELHEVVLVVYEGVHTLVSMEDLKSGKYRMEFIRKTGIPLPQGPPPKKIEKFFTKNIIPSIDLTEKING